MCFQSGFKGGQGRWEFEINGKRLLRDVCICGPIWSNIIDIAYKGDAFQTFPPLSAPPNQSVSGMFVSRFSNFVFYITKPEPVWPASKLSFLFVVLLHVWCYRELLQTLLNISSISFPSTVKVSSLKVTVNYYQHPFDKAEGHKKPEVGRAARPKEVSML